MSTYERIKEQFKDLMYDLSMENEGHLRKVIAELEYVEYLYDEATRLNED